MKKVYIARKINGLKNYREIFKKAEDKQLENGNVCMNSATLGEGFNYEIYMPICLAMLETCDKYICLIIGKAASGQK